jgi:hypothetical protein
MPRYKITKVYVVEAAGKIEARVAFTTAVTNNNEDEYLEYLSIQEIYDSKHSGWATSLKEQLVGSSNNKR